jgi:hypothetical protein
MYSKITLDTIRPQNLSSLLIKLSQSTFNLWSSDSNLVLSYLITTVETMGDTLCLLFLSRARVVSIIFSGNPRRSARRRPATAATQFKISLGALLNNLGTKMPHYVRCLKGNDAKQPKLFDSSLVKHQVTYIPRVSYFKRFYFGRVSS